VKLPGTLQGRKDMLKLADVCPLVFNPVEDKFSKSSDYIQTFYVSDKILIQVFSNGDEIPSATLNNLITGVSSSRSFSSYSINSTDKLYYLTLTGLSDSVYSLTVLGIESEPFCVSDSASVLENTSLIRCSHRDNNSGFDNIWWIGNNQQFVEFRVEAGFKPQGIDQHLENESFRDQKQSIIQLYSIPYESMTFYIGNSSGVPYWVAKILNRMLCVDYFTVNGDRYVRSEDAVPEKTQVSEDGQTFWYTQILETQENDIAGIGGEQQAPDDLTTLAFSLENLKDGDTFRYSESKSAIVNTDLID